MPRPKTYSSSSIGWDVDISHHFENRPETVSITWDDGFHFEGDNSFLRVFHQCEPTDVLNVIDKLIANHKYYDLIMGFDERVLRECPNALFLTESACSWMGRKRDIPDSHFVPKEHPNSVIVYPGCDVTKKRFEVSFLTSSKGFCPGHKLRQEIFEHLPESFGDLKVWKHRSPPRIDDKRTMLEPVQFSICLENSRHNGYYSEKLVDCFVAKTIPIYWGAPNIGEHFNSEGILTFETVDQLKSILKGLTSDYYANRRLAIEENFKLALKGVHQWSLIEDYITAAIDKKHKEGSTRSVVTESVNSNSGRRPYRPLRKP